ncbi:MMPL family transporter [Cellulomonas sp. 73-145]|uniref:MMPL family transporter n=1 Tax=Cellulomonas sp. 73-145 TaxID=1895739 RepID=UPI0025C3C7F0|nr:MMPL family transporter [Cellulomonas sp. 73-145]
MTSARTTGPGPGTRTLRIVLPAVLVLVWLAVGGIGGPYFGRIAEVSSNEPTAYLPTSAQATRVQERLPQFLGGDTIPAVVLVTAGSPLTDAQKTQLATVPKALAGIQGVSGQPSPPIVSQDGTAAQLFVPVKASAAVADTVAAMRSALPGLVPSGTTAYVTGPAGFTGDLVTAFGGIDGILLLVAVAAVLVILVVVYRSPLLPLVVLLTSTFALTAALFTVWWIAKAGVFPLSGQTQGILFILVIGAATDYSLLYVSRYREALRAHQHRWDATRAALRGSFEPILASGGTVIAGLLMLLLSDLQSNRALGPIAAVGIVFAMLAALTLLPSLLLLLGRAAFWPRRPRYAPDAAGADPVPTRGLWARVPRFVVRRARPVWVVGVVVLLAASAGVLQLRASGVPSSDLVLGHSEARTGQQELAQHFPGGSGSPVQVIVAADRLQQTATTLLGTAGVQGVAVVSAASPSGEAPVTAEGVQPVIPGTPAPAPTVANGDVLLQATLTDAPDSAAAEHTVRELRTALGSSALVGGATATAVDSDDASVHDRNLIIPLVLVVILVILVLLLRAVVAPLLLVGTVVLSFGATLGVSALVFNHVLNLPGADPAVPLFGFVFLVALGIDYNIFLMTRVREEALHAGARTGMTRGLAITGGVITSAGVVLAATFAALAVIPILFLLQLAFIVAFGVLLDTVLVRSLLVPALGQELGRSMWWPSRRITA